MLDTVAPPRWSLDDLLAPPVEQSLEAVLASLESKSAAFERCRDQLTPDVSPDTFMAILHDYEEVNIDARRIGAFGTLWFAEDTQNQAALNLRDRVDNVLTSVDNRTLFFTLWIQSMDDDVAARLLPATGDLRYYVDVLRKFKPYTLSEAEERIINVKDANGIDAMMNLYDIATNKLEFTLTIDGETKPLTRDELAAYYRHPSADVRAATYQELYRVFEENSTLLAQMYNYRVRDWSEEGALRGMPSPISARNVANDLPDDVVNTLLDVCRKNNEVFQRYFRLKAKWIGMDKLRRYDVYAPLAQSDKIYEWPLAVDLTMDSFSRFSPDVATMAERVLVEGHLDAEIRKGKRGGAFCYGALPGVTPWVLVNYTGRPRDVATLAHELGHAIHAMLASHHSVLTYHASLPLAETASVFSEMLLTDRLLKEEADPAVRRDLLATAIDGAYATVQRQANFTIFEREAHRLVAEGADVDTLCAAYMDNLHDQFGDSLELSDDFKWEWITIPHIYHVPFYTYAYAFGQLLVLSLYRQYQREGSPFVPRYLELLAYGGSEEPARVLRDAGFDVTSPAFWQGGYDVLREMIDELEAL